MKAAQAKALLDCSYTSLHNYVKRGLLKEAENPTSSKQQEYDDESVYALQDKLSGKKTMHNVVVIWMNNKRYEFKVDKIIINKVLDLLNFEMKRESLHNELSFTS